MYMLTIEQHNLQQDQVNYLVTSDPRFKMADSKTPKAYFASFLAAECWSRSQACLESFAKLVSQHLESFAKLVSQHLESFEKLVSQHLESFAKLVSQHLKQSAKQVKFIISSQFSLTHNTHTLGQSQKC